MVDEHRFKSGGAWLRWGLGGWLLVIGGVIDPFRDRSPLHIRNQAGAYPKTSGTAARIGLCMQLAVRVAAARYRQSLLCDDQLR